MARKAPWFSLQMSSKYWSSPEIVSLSVRSGFRGSQGRVPGSSAQPSSEVRSASALDTACWWTNSIWDHEMEPWSKPLLLGTFKGIIIIGSLGGEKRTCHPQ